VIAVFLGPTLDVATATSILDATYLPPVSQGDVYRVARKRPEAIAIVDGYFESAPSVWHKEILWAMSHGIPVIGCSSMGALRAAELELYGMIGVGSVFADFRDGILEDDDEVAVWHGDAASGYRQLSDALVDIRACIARAAAEGVVHEETAERLIAIGKALYFKDRSYATIMAIAAERNVSPSQLAALRSWLNAHAFSQKHLDAVAMLRAIAGGTMTLRSDHREFNFENTVMWNDFRLFYGDADIELSPDGSDAVTLDDLVDEVRLRPGLYRRVYDDALLRLLALREYRHSGERHEVQHVQEIADAFRRERNLLSEASLRAWCTENEVSYPDGLRNFFDDEACVARVRRKNEANAWYHIVDRLRAGGELPEMLRRARDKRIRLTRLFASQEVAIESDDTVLRWYFTTHLGRPELLDRPTYAVEAGFKDDTDLARAARREYYYSPMHRL
jgi:hypothetical protein